MWSLRQGQIALWSLIVALGSSIGFVAFLDSAKWIKAARYGTRLPASLTVKARFVAKTVASNQNRRKLLIFMFSLGRTGL